MLSEAVDLFTAVFVLFKFPFFSLKPYNKDQMNKQKQHVETQGDLNNTTEIYTFTEKLRYDSAANKDIKLRHQYDDMHIRGQVNK